MSRFAGPRNKRHGKLFDPKYVKEYERLARVVQSSSNGNWLEPDRRFMRAALDLARKAEAAGEVPVGAVITYDGSAIGEGWNRPVSSNDPTAHAEIEALRQAALRTQNYRLPGTTLYVTMEPCAMCAGAMVLARIDRVVFSARDLRFGAVRSKFHLADSELLNHRIRVEEGLLATESAELLTEFFRQRR